MGTYGTKLPSPYKRYAIGPVWRADRPQEGRFREFVQCDIDTVGSTSSLADAEIVWAVAEGPEALGVDDFRFLVNSREALHGLLEGHGIAPALGDGVLATLDKLDKLDNESVIKELVERSVERSVDAATAEDLVGDVAADSPERIRQKLDSTERGKHGLAEIDRLLELTAGLPEGRIVFAPRMVRGLDHYTGPIWEVEAAGYPGAIAAGGRYDHLVASLGGPDVPACGGSIGVERILAIQGTQHTERRGLDVALTVLGDEVEVMRLAAELRGQGLRVGTYLSSSAKLGKQLKWANDQNARFAVLYGHDEQATGEVILRNMQSGDQSKVPLAEAAVYLRRALDHQH
jgi:histidyl-tRNA synthetase